jgi:hypothetical protein
MKRIKLAAVSLLCGALIHVSSQAQAPPPGAEMNDAPMNPGSFLAPPPLTRVEAFGAQHGVLVIKGFTEVAHLAGDNGSAVRVMAVQFTDGARKQRERGLAIHVSENVNNAGTAETISYVDEDEIDALIENVGTLGKLGAEASPMESFEARYQSRGELEVANVNVNGGRVINVRGVQLLPATGQPLFATATFFPARMEEFQQRLIAARQVLERLENGQ